MDTTNNPQNPISHAKDLWKDMIASKKGFNDQTQTYVRMEDVSAKQRMVLRKLFEQLTVEYSRRMGALIRQADATPEIYWDKDFKKYIADIAGNLGNLHDRLQEYAASEHFFLLAIFHEQDIRKKAELYMTLIISLKDEYTKKHTAVPQYKKVIAELLQEIFLRNKTGRDAKLVNTFLALPIKLEEKLEILLEIVPGSEFRCHHYILIAYTYMLLGRPFKAKHYALNAVQLSGGIKISPNLTDLLSKTIAYINDTAKGNQGK